MKPTPPPGELTSIGDPVMKVWGDGDPYFEVQIIQEMKNTGGDWIEVGEGDYTITDAEGGVTETGGMYLFFPKALAPGETGYALGTSILDNVKRADFASVEVDLRYRETEESTDRLSVANLRLKQASYGGGLEATGFVENKGSAEVEQAVVGIFYFDANGKLLGATSSGFVENIGAGDREAFSATSSSTPPIKRSAVTETKAFAVRF